MNLLEAQRAVFMSNLQPLEKLVALALLNHWSRTTETFPSADRLAAWTSLCRRSVLRSLASLEAKGAIAITRSHGRANRYELGALMTVTSDQQSPVPDSHQCTTVTTPVTLSHQSSDTQSPEEIHEEIHVRDPKKSARSRARKPVVVAQEDPKTAAEHTALTKLYFEQFETARGMKPPFDGRDGKAVKELLAKCGSDTAAQAIRGAFTDSWWKGKATIRDIANDPAKFVGLKPFAGNGRSGPPQPNGGSWKAVVES